MDIGVQAAPTGLIILFAINSYKHVVPYGTHSAADESPSGGGPRVIFCLILREVPGLLRLRLRDPGSGGDKR
jgi:hypothetical protein